MSRLIKETRRWRARRQTQCLECFIRTIEDATGVLSYTTYLMCDNAMLYERTFATHEAADREARGALNDARTSGWIHIPSQWL
jgi:hypothetical protein